MPRWRRRLAAAAAGSLLAGGHLGAAFGFDGKWFLVPKDDLAGYEAFEYAILRINDMREECEGFYMAPLQMQDYRAVEVYVQTHELYSAYRLRLEPIHHLAPSSIHVRMARQHSVTDLSQFQVTEVHPPPCDLYSGMDDAELMIPQTSSDGHKAKEAVIKLLNKQRSILCPQRPLLELQRLVAASLQPAEGYVLRLVLEMREASASFHSDSFEDTVLVSYALDQDVPGQCTVSPEVYPGREPCRMRYTQEEQSAGGIARGPHSKWRRRLQASAGGAGTGSQNATATGEPEPRWRSLREMRRSRARGRRRLADDGTAGGRRLFAPLVDAAPAGRDVERQFVEQGLEIPDDFDPRLRRTLCFPRGFSRRQGSCGASYAFAATAVAAFRECLWLLKGGTEMPAGVRFFSAQELTSCDGRGDGCAGGSASSAFYFMKHEGVARESCSKYRMRCFSDSGGVSESAADRETLTARSPDFESSTPSCAIHADPLKAPCKCLPSVFHQAQPVECELLPSACPKVKLPHYFKIAGTAEGSTAPLFERHVMQELLLAGPLYVSLLVFEDFYDPVSWTESGIYVHKRGAILGKHAAACVGWGTDDDSRDYWLLLNSFGNGWQQEGYFKILRGENALEMTKFGAWGADWSNPEADRSKPTIADVEVAFSPVMLDNSDITQEDALSSVWLLVSALTDEDAQVLVRIQGLSSTVMGEQKDTEYRTEHVLKLDLLDLGLLDDRAKIQIWAADRAQNTGTWGPFTLEIPSKKIFRESQEVVARRLLPGDAKSEGQVPFI